MEWLPVAVMLVLIVVNVPVAFAVAIGALSFFMSVQGTQPEALIQRMVSITHSFPMLAIPFFIFTGVAMSRGGMGRRIIRLADVLAGHMIGGLAQINVLVSTLMAGMTGSSVAEAAMVSRVLVPEMAQKGYSKAFAVAVTASSALVATLIPPSIGLILYGVLANVSIGRLFLAGVVPGILVSLALMAVIGVIARRRGYAPTRAERPSWRELAAAFGNAFWALLIPFGVVAGIRFGVFTPTEAGVVAASYATLVGLMIYRELAWRDVWAIALETVLLTSVVMLIISAANALGFYLAWNEIPMRLADAVLAATQNPYVFLVMVNVFLLIAGLFMDGAMLLVLLTPLMIPLVEALGIDPVHFGIVFILNIEIGAVTPPIGIVMYTATSIAGVSLEDYTREALPLFAALIGVLALVTYAPTLALWLPNLVFG